MPRNDTASIAGGYSLPDYRPGVLANVMLATYPEVFAGGAIIAGLPYGCARTVQQALEVMFTDQQTSARALGDRVRAASVYRGPWPKISIWHGSADPIVKPSNAEANIRQWLDIHGLSELPSYEEKVGRHIRRVWNDTGGNILVEAYSISGMAHGVPLGTTLDGDICGTVGPFFLEAGLSSTQRIAESWQLDDNVPLTAQAPTMMFEAAQRRGEAGAVLLPGRDGSTAAAASLDLDRGQTESDPYGASATIAAAFEAAGLPVPAFRDASYVDPAPIIEAALKAAGLTP